MGALTEIDAQKLKDKYQLSYFVETGTGVGDGLNHLMNNVSFQKYFSTELMKELYIHCTNRFANQNNLTLFNLESEDFLKRIVSLIKDKNCLFWLDAHFPGSDYCNVPYDAIEDNDLRLPLEKELNFIYENRKEFNDVIICDDLRIYEEANYEAGNLKDRNLKHIGNFDLSFLDRFKDKYIIEKSLKNEGYLFLFPKL